MTKFIIQRIEQAAEDVSLEAGREKYKAYFVNTRLYKRCRADVDARLTADGYDKVIIAEEK